MERLFQDLRYGIGTLLKKAGFTSITALILALGIGANTAIFSPVNAVSLGPLCFNEPALLVEIQAVNFGRDGQQSGSNASLADLLDWQQWGEAFENLETFSGFSATDPLTMVSVSLFCL